MNLALNARDSMPDRGMLTIKTTNVVLDEEACARLAGSRPGTYAQLTISDTGHGMDSETIGRAFEPFFTTRGLSQRSGLGLSMVHGILEKHRGFIACESKPGEGTTFRVFLPAMTDRLKEEVPAEAGQGPRVGSTILLVDDEQTIRELGGRILRRVGYEVVVAADCRQALEIYRQQQGAVALVILDLIMPGMSGNQCLEELLRIDPDVKVIVSSGHAEEGDQQGFLDKGVKGFIPKPFLVTELIEAVRKVLDVS
jgi:two-component system cell cycle sensor histidine kinase/response regulator CckA